MKLLRAFAGALAAIGLAATVVPSSTSAGQLGVYSYQTISMSTRSVYFLSDINSPCIACFKQTYQFRTGTAGIYTKSTTVPYLPIAVTTSGVRPKAKADGVNVAATLSQGGGSVGATTGGGTCDAGQFQASGSQVRVVMSGTWCSITGFNLWNGRISVVGYTQFGYTWYTVTAS